jgi:hypothetical protein
VLGEQDSVAADHQASARTTERQVGHRADDIRVIARAHADNPAVGAHAGQDLVTRESLRTRHLTAQGWMHDHDYEVECESPSQAVISDSGKGASKSGGTT